MTAKEKIESFASLFGLFGGAIAAYVAIVQLIQSNKEKAESLLWRKAEMGKKLLDELFSNAKANDAFNILDVDGYIITDQENGVKYMINHAQLHSDLRVTGPIKLMPQELQVRYRFDAILQGFSDFEHYIRIGLVIENDLKPALNYYVKIACEFKKEIIAYGLRFGFDLGLDFLMRFEEFKNKKTVVNEEGTLTK
jgi:hypothetical protein